MTEIVLERKVREIASYSKGTHFPRPFLKDGAWICADCLGRLREYDYNGTRRLRHR